VNDHFPVAGTVNLRIWARRVSQNIKVTFLETSNCSFVDKGSSLPICLLPSPPKLGAFLSDRLPGSHFRGLDLNVIE